MCYNHRTVHRPCHHIHERITLCQYAIRPLVRRATTFPYIQALQMPSQHPIFGDDKHNVTLTAEESNEPCVDCCLPELDIFHLDDMTKELGYRISVDVDDSRSKVGVVTKREVVNLVEEPKLQVDENGVMKELDLKCEVVKLPEMKKVDQVTVIKKENGKTVAMISKDAISYTGGLGLLVYVKNPRGCVERAPIMKQAGGVGKNDTNLKLKGVKLPPTKQQDTTTGKNKSGKTAIKSSMTTLPYTGGLGLLVYVMNPRRAAEEARKEKKRIRAAKL
ncbi:hypothetical protein NA57DRAFT_54169 [Rhizodiscina lignyota]|uniref:Uncharacterized protein n=1 Tax=Rhizodiscina lignyota TaxID=1504668 RepID=A0A9P4ME45_9PEZI|nr:hypothetical protein NA57DRAFT_54169 [Rhizodiscina lignyota]